MVDEKKRDRSNKLIGWGIAILAIIFFVASFYMGLDTYR